MLQQPMRKGFISHGIREPLTTRIAGILRSYPDSTQIARELLQNSDDAGSTVQWYLLDHRDHAKHARRSAESNLGSDSSKDARLRLFHEDLEEYMGPALLSGSDSVFEDKDFQSLKNLASSEKRADETKIGQMGIGFNSIYHLTDCPSFISGDQLMIIEPHERIFNGERSELSEGAVRGSFLNPSQGLHEYPDQLKAFSVLEDIDFSKPYKGTIFRFPLRTLEQTKTSSLTKYSRTLEEVQEMLNELKGEALKALLFLKHVQKIVIYERKEDQDKPTKLFEIEIVNSAEVAAQRSELFDNFKRHVRACDSVDEAKVLECSTRPTYRMTHEDGHTTEETWQVTTRIGNIGKTRASMLEASHGDVNIADHKLIPWVGIAAPSDPDFKMDSSGLFCFLPVGDIQLPFPVHVNGHFAVEQSRRDIWTNIDKKIKTQSSAGIESLWNVHLFNKQIPEAYALFLENIGLDHGANYELWPTYCGDGIGRDAIWKDMLKSVLRAVLSNDRPVFFCGPKLDGNVMSIEPYSKVYIAGRDTDAFPLLKKALRAVVDLAENIPDVILAELPVAVESVDLVPRILTSALVISILQDTKNQWSSTADAATRVEMVKYCLQDDKSASLVGLPLLPLAGGSWVEFNRKQSRGRFRVSVAVFRTLSMSNDGLVDIDVEGYPFNDIELGCKSEAKNGSKSKMYWSTMKLSLVAERIKSVYLQSFYQDGVVPGGCVTQTSEQFPMDKWLTDFWNMAHSFPIAVAQRELLSGLDGIHLIPINRGSLAPLSKDRSVLYLNPGTSKDVQVSQKALEVLGHRFDCQVLRKLPIKPSSPLNGYLVDVSIGPRVLGLLSNVDPSCFQQLTPADCEDLRQYLTICLSPRASLDNQQRQVLRYLPVFESYQDTRLVPLDTPSSSSSMKWRVAQGYCISSQPWMPSSVRLLADDQPMKHHIRYLLEIPFLTKAKFLLHLVSELTEQPESEWDSILSELLLGYYEHQKKVDFGPLLRQLPFVQVNVSSTSKEIASPIRIIPRFVADPALSMFFMDEEAVFPSGIYAKSAFRGPLEELGMRLAFNPTFVEERLSSLFGPASSGQDDSHRKASSALYDRLNSMFSKEFVTEDILSMISSLPWLYVGESERCRPSECRPKEDKCLVGTQMSISDFSPSNELLRIHMGWMTPPPLDKVLAHFSSLLDQFSQDSSSQLLNQDVSPIYYYLASMVQNPSHLTAIKEALGERPWILLSGTLYAVDRVAFKLDQNLRPQFGQVHSSNLDALFRAFGVRDHFTHRDIEAILATIGSNYDNGECLSDKDAELVRRLLTALSYMKSRRSMSDLPVLTKGGYLKRAADVVYDDRASRRGGLDDNLLPYTFLDDTIPKGVAQRLQIDMFSVRAWEESKDATFEPFFQEENIVDRIRSILNDYDPSGIFNEYLQNASDAGATKFSVMLDPRTYDKTKVLSDQMAEWQGPALLFYNDAEFSEESFSALCKLGVGNKREDTSKVGRHGLGFNSAYHFTDVPSVISGSTLVIFDPHMVNLPKSRDASGKLFAQRGHRYDIRKLSTETLADQFQPYKGLFGFDMGSHFDGTIFRIPLRLKGAVMAGKSGFGSEDWTTAQIQKMFVSWIEDAKIGSLFLKSIKSINLSDGTNPMVSVTKDDLSHMPAVKFLIGSLPSHTSQVSIVDITSKTTGLGNIASSRWLMYTEDALPANTPQTIRNHVQTEHWSTQSGVAIPLGDDSAIKSCRGRLMVYLPTPIETKLPFHMHGGFALTTNRKTLAGGSEASDPKTLWNTYLLETLLPLTAIQAYGQLLTWSFRPADLDGPRMSDLNTAIPLFYKRWPLKANDDFAAFLRAFFRHAYTSPVFPCRGHPYELPIAAVAGKNTTMRGSLITEAVELRVYAWLRVGGRSIAETPPNLQACLMLEWGQDGSRPFKQIDCNLLRRRFREDPSFITRQMIGRTDKQWLLDEIFRPLVDTRIVVEESLMGLHVVPLLSGEWKPLLSGDWKALQASPIYHTAPAEARELVEGKGQLVDSDFFDSFVLQRVLVILVKEQSYGIEKIQLSAFASIFLSENAFGVSEDKRERIWKYLCEFDDITPACELPIVKTAAGDMVTVAKAAEGLEMSTAYLGESPRRIITEFFRRMGLVMFDASDPQNHPYFRRLQVEYTERRVLELIAKHWSTHAPSFVISTEEADFLRNMIGSHHRGCNASVLVSLGDLPIWRAYGPPGAPLRPAIGSLYMIDHENLEHLGRHPTVLHETNSTYPFEKMGATPTQAATLLRERIMPMFASNALQCTGATKTAYLSLCRSLATTASLLNPRENVLARQALNHAPCFLSRDGSFQTLAHMLVPGEHLTETIFVNEQHRFLNSDLNTILVDGRRFQVEIRRLSTGALEECARFVLSEIANRSAPADQILSRAAHLVRYIYTDPGNTNWMDPQWTFVPREMTPEYPYNQHAPDLPPYMSLSTLCYPTERDFIWTQRGFFPQDLVPPARFKLMFPDIGKHTWREHCEHLGVLAKKVAPTMSTTERQLAFKAIIFKIYKTFEVNASKSETIRDKLKQSLREIMTVPYILNGDDKDPSKAESWVWPHELVFGIDHKIGAHHQAHPSLLKFRDFLVTVGANEMKHIAGQVTVRSKRNVGEMENRITSYFETQDETNGFMDVKFTFEGGKSILAHKVVLASMNEEVIRQLTGSWALTARRDPSNPAIDIIQKEDDYVTFWGLLYFLYTDDLIGTNGPTTLSEASKTFKEQDAEDQLSQRVEYLVALQHLADVYRTDRLKGLIAQELMLPGKVMYSNVFEIREHAELNRDPSVVKYCNQFIRVKENASLIEKYLEDEVASVQARLAALDRYLGDKNNQEVPEEVAYLGCGAELEGGVEARKALTTELDDLTGYLTELKMRHYA
ncbi:hypothetical protein KI688_007665 [Linnemannia hyalina]|uniref:BTB domain-containing protein n=1 Tax=Linnemannia hyalina TaxID=64524 RepID=A0A9P7XKB3_9FUNG|nr:hypothetical protein KI688_007665 [Linnemannia hyalina]